MTKANAVWLWDAVVQKIIRFALPQVYLTITNTASDLVRQNQRSQFLREWADALEDA